MAIDIKKEFGIRSFDPEMFRDRDCPAPNPQAVGAVIEAYPMIEVVSAIKANNQRLPSEVAETIARGEQIRVANMAGYYPFLSESPLMALIDAGVIDPDKYFLGEVGTGTGLHLGTWRKIVRPARYIGFDDDPNMVAASDPVLTALRKKEILSSNTYKIQNLNPEIEIEKADVASATLVAQYVDPRKMLTSLERVGRIQVAGDIIHGDWSVTEEELSNGELPIKHPQLEDSTGVFMKLTGEEYDSLFGKTYKANLTFDKELLNPESLNGRRKFMIHMKNSTYHGGAVYIYKDGFNRVHAQTWTLQAKNPGSNEKVERDIMGIGMLVSDLFANRFPWNSTSIAAMNEIAVRERGMGGIVYGSTTVDNPFKIQLFFGLLRRYQMDLRAVEKLTDPDGLSLLRSVGPVGTKRPFTSVEQALGLIYQYLSPDAQIDKQFDFIGGIQFGSITTKDSVAYRKLVLGKPA